MNIQFFFFLIVAIPAAGMATQSVAVQNLKVSNTKFASSWAEARVDHIQRNPREK